MPCNPEFPRVEGAWNSRVDHLTTCESARSHVQMMNSKSIIRNIVYPAGSTCLASNLPLKALRSLEK